MKIESLEAGRGAAAFALVLFHMNASASFLHLQTFPGLVALVHGVDFFFVISGFIIFHVHRNDIGRPSAVYAFICKRFIRIYPTLWLIMPICALIWLKYHLKISLGQVIDTFLLLPTMQMPVPTVAWTLRHEVLFYISFMVMIWNRSAGVVLYTIWTALVFVQLVLCAQGQGITGLPSFFLSAYELDFVLGAAIALITPTVRPAVWPLFAGFVLVTGGLVLGDVLNLYRTSLVDYGSFAATWWVLALGACFAVLLYGLVAIESLVRMPRWLVAFGSASYALYLVHTPLQLLIGVASPHLPGWVALLAMVALPLAAALVLHRWIERPLGRWLRNALLAQHAEAAAVD